MKTAPIAFLLLGLLLPFADAYAAAGCALEYRFTARWDERPRRFEVELRFDAGDRGDTQVRIAREWAGVTDFERGIRDVRPGGAGIAISGGDEAGKTWKVAHPGRGRVSVKYDLVNDVANVDDDTPIPHRDFYRSMMAASYFHFFGWGALLVPEHLADNVAIPVCVTFTGLGKDWSFASSHGQGQTGGTARMRTVASPSDLRSAVYVGGDFRVLRREIEGRPLYVALRGHWSFDDAKFADTAAAVVRAQRAFWHDYAFPYFLVTLLPNRLPTGSTGGTAIEHSFAMHAANDFAVPSPDFYTLLAHEHQHTWIPRRIGTMGRDDDEPRYYWFSEGFTDYITHRALVASGMWTLDDYAKALNGVIERYDSSRVRNAPNAVILKEFWKEQDVQRLPYMRGELVALHWSGALAARQQSLEATLRRLKRDRDWEDEDLAHRPENYAVNRLESALRKELGASVDADVASLVERGETVPMDARFLGPCFTGARVTRPRFELGFDTQSIKTRTISGVVPGSAAEKAGLRDGMALAGGSVRFDDADEEAEIRITESDKTVKSFRYLPRGAQGFETWEFHVIPGAGRESGCERWMEAR
jgi:predicted metalloprotease with PDZ domain